ncbi:MAG: hypothetical protein Q8L11_05070 [Candidatus Moranbacteria bacterium]|nr:hypothetical protein [Candidatus Moranbacteria bacterium]
MTQKQVRDTLNIIKSRMDPVVKHISIVENGEKRLYSIKGKILSKYKINKKEVSSHTSVVRADLWILKVKGMMDIKKDILSWHQ